ncbi:GAF and ANTAR domain-containing protein [Kribbella sp. NPDC051952]|uniref:GAF and ANTAR domain-containing protein n=1 Tax=Kribbella sp. NPDC051952 TaxID=3154851 RepID=UPI00342533EA
MDHNRGAKVWSAIDAVARSNGEPPSLRYAVIACAEAMDAIGGALSMRRDGREFEPLLATDPDVGELEELQATLGEGPSGDVLATGTPVLRADLSDVDSGRRWPSFAPAATELGVRGLFAFPVGAGAARLGVLTVYRRQTGYLQPDQIQDALIYADALFVLALDARRGLSSDLHEVIDAAFSARRAEVHQAAGVIASQQRINVADGLARLRAYAYSRGRPLHEVAADVMAGRVVLDSGLDGVPRDFEQEED